MCVVLLLLFFVCFLPQKQQQFLPSVKLCKSSSFTFHLSSQLISLSSTCISDSHFEPKYFFSFFLFSIFLDAVEHLRDHVEELGDIGADNRDLDFLRQIFEDPTLLKVVDVSDSFSPL